MFNQRSAHAMALAIGPDIGVANQVDVKHRLVGLIMGSTVVPREVARMMPDR